MRRVDLPTRRVGGASSGRVSSKHHGRGDLVESLVMNGLNHMKVSLLETRKHTSVEQLK